MNNFDHITTIKAVSIYEATNNIFDALLREIRELSKKKPDAILSAGKVKLINRVLVDLKEILANEPQGKFLDLLDDQDLPQTSDALLIMVQFQTALKAFYERYHKAIYWIEAGKTYSWITPEVISELEEHTKEIRAEREAERAEQELDDDVI